MTSKLPLRLAAVLAASTAFLSGAQAQVSAPAAQHSSSNEQAGNAASNCPVTHDQLKQAVSKAVQQPNGGLPTDEWAAVINRQGVVCAIAFSGKKPTDQWLGSRAIAIEKANTVNAFSLDSYAISTANLWAPTQPGGSLFDLGLSNPVVEHEVYAGDPDQYGTKTDPILGKNPGGVMVFGGGLALYNDQKQLVGGLGASGNTSCADHNIAWRMREQLGFDNVPNGPSPDHNDEIIYDIGKDGKSKTGWGHPTCGMSAPKIAKQINSGVVLLPEASNTKASASPQPPASPPASAEPHAVPVLPLPQPSQGSAEPSNQTEKKSPLTEQGGNSGKANPIVSSKPEAEHPYHPTESNRPSAGGLPSWMK